MIIKDNNLQKWLFDYFEGNLTPHEEVELNNFIQQNPAYQSEFDAWEKSYRIQKEKKGKKVPLYAGASTLLVETSIWARFNWKYAAAIIMLLGGAGAIGYMSLPSVEEVTEENISNVSLEEKVSLEENVENSSLLTINETNLSTEEIDNTTVHTNNQSFDNSSNETYKERMNNTIGSSVISVENQERTENDQAQLEYGQLNKEVNKPGNNVLNNSEEVNAIANNITYSENEYRNHDDKNLTTTNRGVSETNNKSQIARRIHAKDIEYNTERKVGKSPKKKNKRFYYQGFKNVAGRGIRTNKEKDEKRQLTEKAEDPFISENNYHESSKDKLRNGKKKPYRSNMDLALVNLYDPIFIQTKCHPLAINAAMTGQLGLPRIKTTNRIQINNSNDHLFYSATSFDMYIDKIKAGVGIIAEHQNFGSGMYKNNTFGLLYAQKFEINRESSVTAAVKYSLGNNAMNKGKLAYNTMLEYEKGEVHNTFSDVSNVEKSSGLTHDMGVGVWYNGQYLYGGINVDNILQSKNNVFNESEAGNKKPVSYAVQLGTDYRKSNFSDWVISPQLSYLQEGNNKKLWVGSTFKFRSFVAGVGAGMISSNSLKGMIGVQNNVFRINYSMDYSNSSIEKGMFASHEISLRILIGAARNNWSRF